MNRNIIIGLVLCLGIIVAVLSASLVSASLGTFKQNTCLSIRVLSNCSSINLTEVTNSNLTYKINQPMTKLGGQTFNYTFCNTTTIDSYSFSWNDPCLDCSQGGCGNTFDITATGQPLTISKAVTYILIFIVSFLIFIGLLIMGIALPVSNNRDEMTGYILAISNLKYFKLLCLGLSYVVALFIAYFIWMVSYAYLDMDFLANIFHFIFVILAVLSLPLFILFCYLSIANWVRDSQIGEMIQRGLHVS